MNTDSVTLIIVAVFALIALILLFTRALMEDLCRTVEAWRKLRDTLRGGKDA